MKLMICLVLYYVISRPVANIYNSRAIARCQHQYPNDSNSYSVVTIILLVHVLGRTEEIRRSGH